MTTRVTSFSAPVRHYRTSNLQRTSFSTPHLTPKHIPFPKTMKSPASSHEAAQKVFEANKFVAKPPSGWKERFIVIQDNEENKLKKSRQENTPTKLSKPPLSFEDYKAKHLQILEEFVESQKKYYDMNTIIRGYEGYCEGKYQSYLIEREQINAGIIF